MSFIKLINLQNNLKTLQNEGSWIEEQINSLLKRKNEISSKIENSKVEFNESMKSFKPSSSVLNDEDMAYILQPENVNVYKKQLSLILKRFRVSIAEMSELELNIFGDKTLFSVDLRRKPLKILNSCLIKLIANDGIIKFSNSTLKQKQDLYLMKNSQSMFGVYKLEDDGNLVELKHYFGANPAVEYIMRFIG